MTDNMKKFIKVNKKFKIVSGGHVGADGKSITNINDTVGVEYRFKNDKKMILTREDVLSEPSFEPEWDL